jgi:ribosomal protein S27AE
MYGSEQLLAIRRIKALGVSYRLIDKALEAPVGTVRVLLRIRKVNRKRKCVRCKKRFKQSLHAHHTNYITDSYRLICAKCHGQLHQRRRDNVKAATKRRIIEANLAANLRAERKERGLLLKQVAAAMGISMPYLSDLERGYRTWSAALIERFQNAIRPVKKKRA